MKTVALSLLASLAMTSAAAAQHADHSGHAAAKPAAAQVEGVGVVKKIDAKAGTITIAHEPIKALKWPAMVMPFKVADTAVLTKARVGSKVRFQLAGQTIVDLRDF